MSGIKTDLKNLGQVIIYIWELAFKFAFERQGYSPWMATNLAEEKYKQLHK